MTPAAVKQPYLSFLLSFQSLFSFLFFPSSFPSSTLPPKESPLFAPSLSIILLLSQFYFSSSSSSTGPYTYSSCCPRHHHHSHSSSHFSSYLILSLILLSLTTPLIEAKSPSSPSLFSDPSSSSSSSSSSTSSDPDISNTTDDIDNNNNSSDGEGSNQNNHQSKKHHRNNKENNDDIDSMATAAPAIAPTATSGGGRSRPPTNTQNPSPTTANPLPTTQTTILATTTTTTTTTRSFSDNIITVDIPTSSSKNNGNPNPTGSSVQPTDTPWGTIVDNNTNGPTMVTVSLVVVFVVLAGLGAVVFCLFRTRRSKARRAMRSASFIDTTTFSGVPGGKNNKRDSILSLSGVGAPGSKGSGIFLGTTGSANGSRTGSSQASEIDINRALQEMSELHQSRRLSKRSSTLSLGHTNRMLSPTMTAAAAVVARRSSMQSGYWSGSNSGGTSGATGGGGGGGGNSRANSIVVGNGDSVSSSPESGEFRNSQYGEHYGRVTPISPPLPAAAADGAAALYLQAAARGSSSRHNSSEHLQQQNVMQEQNSGSSPRPSTGTDSVVVVMADRSISSPVCAPRSHSMNHSTEDLRPLSMMQTPSTLVIPPSITTRRRSMMNTHSMYLAQGGAGTPTTPQKQYGVLPMSPPQPYQYSQFSPPQQQPYQFQQQQQYYADSSYHQQYVESPTSNYVSEPSQRGADQEGTAAAQNRGYSHNEHQIEIAMEEDEAVGAAGVGVSGGFSSPSLSYS